MPIFGQVWLWSSLAFLLGALLCWLLVARPARKRVGELENQLASRARRQPAPERPPESRRRQADEMEEDFARAMVPGLGDRFADDSSEYLTRAYALRDAPEAEPRPPAGPPLSALEGGLVAPPETGTELPDASRAAAATQYLNVSAGSLPADSRQPLEAPPEVPPSSPPSSDRGWFDDELRGEAANQPPEEQPALPGRLTSADLPIPGSLDARLVDDADEAVPVEQAQPRSAIEDDSGGTIFTQRTRPIPGELIRQIDEGGVADATRDDALVDDFADDLADSADGARHERTVESEPVAAPNEAPTGVSNGVEPTPAPVTSRAEPVGEPTEVVSAVTPTASEPVRWEEHEITPGVTVQVQQTPNKLPKRVPSKPQHRVPFGVQPAAEPEPAPTTTGSNTSEPTRALFEPIVPAGDAAPVPPPPHRMRGEGNGRAPFGPGSAMPLPGGASPSPEFTIKASVAALRYCTPDSPQFGRTVAEVWFRSAADAERVGFRPVG